MAFTNIIFDLDGTLIDSARITGRIINQMLAERGADAPADLGTIRAMDAVGGEAMIAAVMGRHSPDPAVDLEDFRARYRAIEVPGDLAFPGVVDGLAQLAAAKIRMSICSNKPQYLCEKILSELGLADHFDVIIGSDPSRARKPAPETALLALSGMHAAPSDTLYCGDSIVDVETAAAARIAFALTEWGYGTADALATHPHLLTLHSMQSLLDLMRVNSCANSLRGS